MRIIYWLFLSYFLNIVSFESCLSSTDAAEDIAGSRSPVASRSPEDESKKGSNKRLRLNESDPDASIESKQGSSSVVAPSSPVLTIERADEESPAGAGGPGSGGSGGAADPDSASAVSTTRREDEGGPAGGALALTSEILAFVSASAPAAVTTSTPSSAPVAAIFTAGEGDGDSGAPPAIANVLEERVFYRSLKEDGRTTDGIYVSELLWGKKDLWTNSADHPSLKYSGTNLIVKAFVVIRDAAGVVEKYAEYLTSDVFKEFPAATGPAMFRNGGTKGGVEKEKSVIYSAGPLNHAEDGFLEKISNVTAIENLKALYGRLTEGHTLLARGMELFSNNKPCNRCFKELYNAFYDDEEIGSSGAGASGSSPLPEGISLRNLRGGGGEPFYLLIHKGGEYNVPFFGKKGKDDNVLGNQKGGKHFKLGETSVFQNKGITRRRLCEREHGKRLFYNVEPIFLYEKKMSGEEKMSGEDEMTLHSYSYDLIENHLKKNIFLKV